MRRQWRQAKEAKLAVFLRETTLNHAQLPLPTGSAHFLAGLKIVSVDEAKGTLIVTGAGLPRSTHPCSSGGRFSSPRASAPRLATHP